MQNYIQQPPGYTAVGPQSYAQNLESYPLNSYGVPQQISANMPSGEVTGGDWQNSLCDCSPCGSCILGSFVPCLLVGRASSRLQDPHNPSPEYFNGDCMIHGVLTLLASGWIFSMIKRTEIRERFGIPGSGCGDCCTAFWCQCCQVVQADKEVKSRLISGPIHQGYQSQTEGMKMPHN